MPKMHSLSPFSALSRGAKVDLTIDKLAFGGKALGRVDGYVVFVDHAVPGQRVRVRITRKKTQFAEAEVVQVLEQSPVYEPPFCPHFGICGGCQWQDLNYAEQLRWKHVHVQECLRQLPGLNADDILPPVASPQQLYYRNKMEFTFAPRAWLPAEKLVAGKTSGPGACALGLHVGASFHQIFNLEQCFLQSSQSTAIVKEVRGWCAKSGLAAYNTRNHRGFWRFLVVREGKGTGQTLVHLITSQTGDPAAVEALAAHLISRFPGITTLVHSRSGKRAQVAVGETSRTLYGPGYIEEQIGDLRLRVSAQAFLQTNTAATASLYETIKRLGKFTGQETVWDLYCGAGSIALFLAPHVRRVVGFELVEAAVQDAYINSRLNGVENCQFLVGDLKERLREIGSCEKSPPEVVVTDPLRAGMHPQVVQALLKLLPRSLIYVSCNPSTLARDLALLQEKYEVLSVQPFDLFPQTSHIECVTHLTRHR
ncbi:MAG: 23S rRNA (uracil(1939)-C(5))-methyltransferase RlmD [Thermodesulfobacteriota bacterium]